MYESITSFLLVQSYYFSTCEGVYVLLYFIFSGIKRFFKIIILNVKCGLKPQLDPPAPVFLFTSDLHLP